MQIILRFIIIPTKYILYIRPSRYLYIHSIPMTYLTINKHKEKLKM